MTADPHKAAITAAFDAAADSFDRSEHWWVIARKTVDGLTLQPGMTVLDVACGTGSAAIPAAAAVAPDGHVLGIDISQRMLDAARDNARRGAVDHLVDWRRGDIDDLALGGATFDAVICVFGIFFVPDMLHAATELWNSVAPGGRLAVTSWGERVLQPAGRIFWEAVEAERPDLVQRHSPWHSIRTPEKLAVLLNQAGATDVSVELQENWQPIDGESWWDRVRGSGFRATIDKLTPDELSRVRARCTDALQAAGVDSVEMNVLYATARRTQ